jgi:hypothetical protein
LRGQGPQLNRRGGGRAQGVVRDRALSKAIALALAIRNGRRMNVANSDLCKGTTRHIDGPIPPPDPPCRPDPGQAPDPTRQPEEHGIEYEAPRPPADSTLAVQPRLVLASVASAASCEPAWGSRPMALLGSAEPK